MEKHDFAGLQATLDDQLKFPTPFLFKFIVPLEQLPNVMALFHSDHITTKPSKNGNYISATAEVEMRSSEEIIEIYVAASKIKGAILL